MKPLPFKLFAFICLLSASPARAEDFSLTLPALSTPFLLSGLVAALILRFSLRRQPQQASPYARLRKWFRVTGIPCAVAGGLSLGYLAEGNWGHAPYQVLLFLYFWAFHFAFKAARQDPPEPGHNKIRTLLRAAMLTISIVFLGRAAYEMKTQPTKEQPADLHISFQ